jgi:hypothetical protein
VTLAASPDYWAKRMRFMEVVSQYSVTVSMCPSVMWKTTA